MKLILLLLTTCLSLLHLQPAFADSDELITIGVLAHRGNEAALKRWSQTAIYLTEKIDHYNFIIKPLNLSDMREAVRNRQVDFILTNPGNYVELETSFGATRIATLKKKQRQLTFTSFSAVIFTRKDRDDINTLEDLRGKSFMAVKPNAFGGFQMAWLELKKVGIDPFNDFERLEFSGFPQDNIVYAVQSGKIDAGTVRSDTIERMSKEGAISIHDFKVLNPYHNDNFPLLHSTRLYPEWPFAKLNHTNDVLAEDVALALLTMPANSKAAKVSRSEGWTIPLDYTPVHELFKTLQVGPYAELGIITFEKVLQQYGHILLMVVVTLVLLTITMLYVIRANNNLNLSQQALRSEIVQREQIQRELQQHRDMLEHNVELRTHELAQLNKELQEDIIARQLAESALKKSSHTLQTMHEITSSRHMSFEGKVDALLRTGCQCFSMDYGALSLLIDDQLLITRFAGEHPKLKRGTRVNISQSFAEKLNIDSDPLLINNIQNTGWVKHEAYKQRPIGSYMGIPVIVSGHLYGCLEFGSASAREGGFSPIDFDMLQLIAQWMGGEIERQQSQDNAQKHQADLAHVARLSTMGEMASGLAHELNQPLTAIVNYTRGCIRRLSDNDSDMGAIVNAMERSSSEAERAAEIIRRMRELAKKEDSYHREFIPINDTIEVVINLLQHEIRSRRVTIKRQLSKHLDDVLIDHIQIEQVLINLIMNGMDAMKQTPATDREMIIRSKQENDSIIVSIFDRGIGLPENMRGDVFEPFFSTKNEGMGMGLSISRSIIEAHDGSLMAKQRDGGGSIFSFTLPARSSHTPGEE